MRGLVRLLRDKSDRQQQVGVVHKIALSRRAGQDRTIAIGLVPDELSIDGAAFGSPIGAIPLSPGLFHFDDGCRSGSDSLAAFDGDAPRLIASQPVHHDVSTGPRLWPHRSSVCTECCSSVTRTKKMIFQTRNPCKGARLATLGPLREGYTRK